MGGAFDKDGAGTFVVEMIPGGGLITAPIHAAAGNHGHAVAAAAGAALGFVLPGGGCAVAKAAINGGKRIVAKEVVKVAAKVAATGAVKGGIKKGANAIRKHHQK